MARGWDSTPTTRANRRASGSVKSPTPQYKINCSIPFASPIGGGDYRFEQFVIDLEESIRAEAVRLAADGTADNIRFETGERRSDRDALITHDGVNVPRHAGGFSEYLTSHLLQRFL